MAKVKVPRKSTRIDMTAMSDVTVLLLTFFMLTSTFVKKEPVQVTTPGSVSEIKIPDTNILQILIEPTGKVFMSLDKQGDMVNTLKAVSGRYGIEYAATFDTDNNKIVSTDGTKADATLLNKFKLLQTFGCDISRMKDFLALEISAQDKELGSLGIPTKVDSTIIVGPRGEFECWIYEARQQNKDLKIAIKADQNTPYKTIKDVMSSLQYLKENRYNLITSLKQESK
jgi:biopolymer transport protein ExbD